MNDFPDNVIIGLRIEMSVVILMRFINTAYYLLLLFLYRNLWVVVVEFSSQKMYNFQAPLPLVPYANSSFNILINLVMEAKPSFVFRLDVILKLLRSFAVLVVHFLQIHTIDTTLAEWWAKALWQLVLFQPGLDLFFSPLRRVGFLYIWKFGFICRCWWLLDFRLTRNDHWLSLQVERCLKRMKWGVLVFFF